MTNDFGSSEGRATDIDRRGFLTRVAGSALVVGAASPAVNLLAAFPEPAATPGSVFHPLLAESDAAVFAEARKHFLIPTGVTYCNTGTLGASPREVLTTDQEHGGCISPWRLKAKRFGIVVKELRLDDGTKDGTDGVVKLFADAMTPRTKVVMFSHIVSGLGTLMPARELCAMIRDRGALALVDGAQAVGQIQVDVKALGCDAYVASPHKWMMAPKGTGLLYIRRDIQDRFWTTLASSHWDDHESGAFRFMQYGTGAVPVHEGLTAALAFIQKIGMPRIERWDAMLTKRLRDGLSRIPVARITSPADPSLASAITTFRVEGVKAKPLCHRRVDDQRLRHRPRSRIAPQDRRAQRWRLQRHWG